MVQQVQITEAERVEEAINLKRQAASLQSYSDAQMIFQDTSPPKRWGIVYSMQTGEPIRVAAHRLEHVLSKQLDDGRPAFTGSRERAPTYRLGDVKCFLARDSEEREAVDALNIAPGFYCQAEHLANSYAARVHAEKKHPTSWRIYSEHIEALEREQEREERRQQTDAMLRLAGGKARRGMSDGEQ